MKLSAKRNILVLLLFCCYPVILFAQNNTSSLYSYYGIGDLSNVAYGRNLALGGTGYALRSSNHLNLKNPASLTAIDSLSILFEMGVFGKYTHSKANNESSSNIDGNLSHVAMGHRLGGRFMIAYGLMPYSDIGYNFKTYETVQGESSYVVSLYQGSGGITKYFGSLGFKVSDNFSLGFEMGTLYGPISETVKTTALAISSNPASMYIDVDYKALTAELGFQYVKKVGQNGSSITLGGIFKPSQLFFGTYNVNINQTYNGSVTSVVYSDEYQADRYSLPLVVGGGISYIHKNKFLYTFDVESQFWSKNGSDYKDRLVYSVGIERMPQQSLDYFDRCSYRIGYSYDSGYITMSKYTINDMRFALGVGLPVLKERSSLNVSFEAGQRGTMQLGLVRERYLQMSVAFSFHDYWFVKRKID